MLKITLPDVVTSKGVRVHATMNADGSIRASTITVAMEDFQAHPEVWAEMQSGTTTIMVEAKQHHYPLTLEEALARIAKGTPSQVIRVDFKDKTGHLTPSYRLFRPHGAIPGEVTTRRDGSLKFIPTRTIPASHVESMARLSDVEHEFVSQEIRDRIKADLGVMSLEPKCSAAGLEVIEELINDATTIWLSNEH